MPDEDEEAIREEISEQGGNPDCLHCFLSLFVQGWVNTEKAGYSLEQAVRDVAQLFCEMIKCEGDEELRRYLFRYMLLELGVDSSPEHAQKILSTTGTPPEQRRRAH